MKHESDREFGSIVSGHEAFRGVGRGILSIDISRDGRYISGNIHWDEGRWLKKRYTRVGKM